MKTAIHAVIFGFLLSACGSSAQSENASPVNSKIKDDAQELAAVGVALKKYVERQWTLGFKYSVYFVPPGSFSRRSPEVSAPSGVSAVIKISDDYIYDSGVIKDRRTKADCVRVTPVVARRSTDGMIIVLYWYMGNTGTGAVQYRMAKKDNAWFVAEILAGSEA